MANEGADYTSNEQSPAQLPPASIENVSNGLNKANSTLTTISNKITSNTTAVNNSKKELTKSLAENTIGLNEIKVALNKNDEKLIDAVNKLIKINKEDKKPEKVKIQTEENKEEKEPNRGLLGELRKLLQSKIVLKSEQAGKEKPVRKELTPEEKKERGWLGSEIKGLFEDISLLRKLSKKSTEEAKNVTTTKTELSGAITPKSAGVASVANINEVFKGAALDRPEAKESAGESALDVLKPEEKETKPIQISIVEIKDEVLEKITKALGLEKKKDEKEQEPTKKKEKDRGLVGDVLDFLKSRQGRTLIRKGKVLTRAGGRGLVQAGKTVGRTVMSGASRVGQLFTGATGRAALQLAGKAALPVAAAAGAYKIGEAGYEYYQMRKAEKQAEETGKAADTAEASLKIAREEKSKAEADAKASGKTTFTFRGKEFKVGEPNKLVEAPGTITGTNIPTTREATPAPVKIEAKPATTVTQPEPAKVTAEPAIKTITPEPEKQTSATVPSTVISPAGNERIAQITKQPEVQTTQQVVATLPPELLKTFDNLIQTLTITKKEKGDIISSDVNNTSNNNTYINIHGGGDDIGSSRSKTDKKLIYFRNLA